MSEERAAWDDAPNPEAEVQESIGGGKRDSAKESSKLQASKKLKGARTGRNPQTGAP